MLKMGPLGRRQVSFTAVLAIGAVLTFLVAGLASATASGTPPASRVSAASSTSTPHVNRALVRNYQESLCLCAQSALYIFGMANGGNHPSTGFEPNELVTAADREGNIAAAIDVIQAESNNFTTSDAHHSIGAVGIRGFQYYGEETKTLIPPVQPTSTLSESLALPEAALVVVVALSGGQNSIVLGGIPGLVVDANGTGGSWSGVMIAQAELSSGTYTVTEATTNHDSGGLNRADVIGIFAFSNSIAGFIEQQLPVRILKTIPVGLSQNGLSDVVYDSGKGEIFVLNSYSRGPVKVISDVTDKVVASILLPWGSWPYCAVYDSGKGEVFVFGDLSPVPVVVISDATDKVVASIHLSTGSAFSAAAYDSEKGEVFATDENTNHVSVINDTSDKVVANIAVQSTPYAIAYDSARGELFVTDAGTSNVSVISDRTNKVVATILAVPEDEAIQGVAYDSGTGEVYVANFAYSVSVISDKTNEVVSTVHVEGYASVMAYDSVKGEILVGTADSAGTLNVISDETDKVVARIFVGADVGGMAYDSGNGEVYLVPALYGQSTVEVISD
jgi:YVTN family beta-propeller protein